MILFGGKKKVCIIIISCSWVTPSGIRFQGYEEREGEGEGGRAEARPGAVLLQRTPLDYCQRRVGAHFPNPYIDISNRFSYEREGMKINKGKLCIYDFNCIGSLTLLVDHIYLSHSVIIGMIGPSALSAVVIMEWIIIISMSSTLLAWGHPLHSVIACCNLSCIIMFVQVANLATRSWSSGLACTLR